MFSSLSNYLPTSVSAAASSLGAMAKSVGAQALSYGSRAIEQLALNDPSAQKVYLGTALTLGGGAGLAKAARDASMSNKSRYVLGGVSAASLASGVYFLTSGIQELYNRTHAVAAEPAPINMCDTRPGFCDGNLGIPRENMPQIEGETMTNFLKYHEEQGVTVEHTTMLAKELHPTQNEINQGMVLGIVAAAKAGTFKPCEAEILVSTDGHVVDGHHRWAACAELDLPIHVAAVGTSIENLLATSKTFPGVVYQGLAQFSSIPAAK